MEISRVEYRRILRRMPLLCVDGVILNSAGCVLLVKRKNEPLKNRWWVPGGRVLKGESLEHAFRRKMREELGIRISGARCIGYSEATALRHRGLNPTTGLLRSVSFVFETRFDATSIKLDSQSSSWGYFAKLPASFKIRFFTAESPS